MNTQHIVIILPTYNEKDNILAILQAILTQKDKLHGYLLSILVVDDNSPDGTSDLVLSYAKENPEVHLLRGKKNGLGSAYIRGFKYAMRVLNADILFEMDADFSHNPDDIPRFIQKMETTKSDFVIGSRYIYGGSIPSNWSTLRKLNSKMGNIFARHIAGIKNVHDTTGGYRAIRSSLLRRINLDRLAAKGYAFQIDLLYKAIQKKARITEMPIVFIDRQHGSSKIRLADITEFIFHSFSLRFGWVDKIVQVLLSLSIVALLALIGFDMFLHNPHFQLTIVVTLVSLFMILQASMSLYWMLYAWDRPGKADATKSPKQFFDPKYSFTAIVPARNEANVIAATIEAIAKIHYPEELKQTIIVCRYDDVKTIAQVQKTISELGIINTELAIFYDDPINKPHALNVGLQQAKKDIVVIFDAEDEPHYDIYNIANTVMQQKRADVLQSGVQLMNYRSSWFSMFNVLEYFFWFKSTLQFFANAGIIPLGGNTVFIKKASLEKVNGWDENCLTEDADIGIRLSTKGERIRIVYDEQHTTREESPLHLSHFMKQRTRWNQGFLQVFFKKDWLRLKTLKQRSLAGFILLSPFLQSLLFLYLPFSFFLIWYSQLPVWLALLSTIPLFLLILQVLSYNIGLYLFTRDYHLPYRFWFPIFLTIAFIPFQLVLGLSSVRAVVRLILQIDTWEKTHHVNAHRTSAVQVAV